MKLNTLPSYKKRNKRVGRGRATGFGKTSGRGHGGQKSRAGKKIRAGFEGGQTPIFQRLPKYRGFKNPNYIDYQVVNVGQLQDLSAKTITREVLLESRLISKKTLPVKILGKGELSKALKIEVEKASQSAIDKISKAGGSFTSTAPEKPEKKVKEKKVKKKTAEKAEEETKEEKADEEKTEETK